MAGFPEIFEDMDEILDHDGLHLVAPGGGIDLG
jgi:hypothetical protein